jgi:putative toxin-antitoxin system antitoxin component (TIGR02293 family)
MIRMAERLIKTPEPDFSIVPQTLMAHALDTFGTADKARSWLATPNPALNDEEPLELARTAKGAERVEEVLTRIDYGIFS